MPSNEITYLSVPVPLNGTVSPEFDISGKSIVAVRLPANFTGATMKFDVAFDDVNFSRLYTEGGAEHVLTVVAGKIQVINPVTLMPFKKFRIVVAAQAAAQDIQFAARPLL